MIPRVPQTDNPRLLKRLSPAEKLKLGISDGGGGGFNPTGTPDGTKFLRDDVSWQTPPGAGGGDSITINAAATTDDNLNDTLPAAPAGSLNVKWQLDTATAPDNVSAYVKTDNVSLEINTLAIRRAALTGDVTAAAGANATTIKNDVALAGNPTTTTQAANNNSTRIATTAYVNAVATGTNTGDVTLAGTPTYITIAGQVITRGNVDLANSVTGDLPFANLAPATAISKLLGRGSAAGVGDFQEITLGTNLTMTGTTLDAAGGGGTPPTGSGVYGVTAGVMDAAAVTIGTGLTKAAGDLHVNTATVEMQANKGQINGYCGLDASALVNPFDLADLGTPGATTYLRGDQRWVVPPVGSGNAVYATVDFGSAFTHSAIVTVTGQTWVAGTSKIVATVLSAAGKGIEDSVLSFSASASDLVVGDGFNLNVYSPVKAKGTYTFSCVGV